MSQAALEALRESSAGLIRALEGHDPAAIETATAAIGAAVDRVRAVGDWHDDVELRDGLAGLAPLLLDAQTRVNFLTDRARRRVDGLAALGARLPVQTYGREGR